MSVFRRLTGRSKKPEEENEPVVEFREAPGTKAIEPEIIEPTPAPMGTLVATAEDVGFDPKTTAEHARRASIKPQSAAEIVPGHVLKRDELGRVHIKIVFYGPSLSGKTT
ncbi:MAG: hypothetical protein ACFFFK_09425, partial [Candidatus Thorarchaeota archaeon]